MNDKVRIKKNILKKFFENDTNEVQDEKTNIKNHNDEEKNFSSKIVNITKNSGKRNNQLVGFENDDDEKDLEELSKTDNLYRILKELEDQLLGDPENEIENKINNIYEKHLDEYSNNANNNTENVDNFSENTEIHNIYNFNYDKVSEEDIIKGAIQSNISVFLHGGSSEGKSSRVKQLDPDLEIIYLRNITPDALNGKSVVLNVGESTLSNLIIKDKYETLSKKYKNNEITEKEFDEGILNIETNKSKMIDIEPTWYKKLKEKCDREPNKLHIVFFDEVTNALPSIQGMAYNIILDKEVNGIWKLPSNARIVAAGNEMKDSLAANQLAEPLYNRFAHVNIKTTVNSWIEWAITPVESYNRLDVINKIKHDKIHPAIVAYIALKRDKALRTKFNGITPNADPRKWEMASKMLYTTNKPEMLRSLLGYDITADFINFTKVQSISLEDVINGNYSNEIFNVNVSRKWEVICGLMAVTETNIEVVCKFIKNMGPEYLKMFASLWAGNNENRKEIFVDVISELEYLESEKNKVLSKKPWKRN